MLKASTNFIWCKLDKSCSGTTGDIYLCGAYIPPLNSTYFLPDIFEELEKDISFFNSQGSILLLGDLNARTGKYNDHLEMSDKNYLEIDMFENTENISQRNNCDNILNSHGKIVLQILQEFRSTHFKWAEKRRFSGKHNFSWKKWCKHCRLYYM